MTQGLPHHHPAAELHALAIIPDGIAVGGDFLLSAGGQVNVNVAHYATICPASAIISGSGCSSSVGPMMLVANEQPWVGRRRRLSGPALAVADIARPLSVAIPCQRLPESPMRAR